MAQTRRDMLGAVGLTGAAVAAAGAAEAGEAATAKLKTDRYPQIKKAIEIGAQAPDVLKGKVQRPDLLTRQVGVDLAIYDPQTRMVHMLNSTAATIWRHVEPSRTTKSVYDMFALAYQDCGAKTERIVQDVVQTLASFEAMTLIVPEAEAQKYQPGAGVETTITDLDLSSGQGGYTRPTVRSVTLDQLSRNYKLALALQAIFCDTWISVGVRSRPA